MGFVDSNIAQLSAEVGEKIIGRTGGAVSLAVGMAQYFQYPRLNILNVVLVSFCHYV